MTCGLFLILHHVLCVLAIDPGTSTECIETPVCEEPGHYSELKETKHLKYRFVVETDAKDLSDFIFYFLLTFVLALL